MPFSTIGVAKQKGGSVGSSGQHNDRERDAPNADPSRSHLNRVVLGEEGPVRETVSRIIDEHGGKPRHDSVEAIELVLSASHEYFVGRDGEIDDEKTERFVEQAVKFLSDRSNCGICAKAVLHRDERTPHIHAHMVPITENGKLSASQFLDGRQKMKDLHTRYAGYMEELGLERGREGSRATHQRVKQFYASVTREPELTIDPEKIPDPARLKMLTADGVREYKLEVLRHVLEQVKEPVQVLQDQAQLTRDEHAHRVEAERRADEAERLAAERVAQSQRQAQARIAEVEREAEAKIAKNREEADERHNTLSRSSKALAGELEDVTKERDVLLTERSALEQQVKAEIRERFRLSALARASGDRLTDIPMPEVMERLGYEGESRGGQYTYPGSDGRAALIIQGQKAYDSKGELICRNSMDLVVFMRRENEGVEGFTKMRALAWLRDEFGGPRAAAAYLVNQEQHLHNIFARDHAGREREQGEPDRGSGPWRAGSEVGQEPERTSPGHDTPSHGYDFGR